MAKKSYSEPKKITGQKPKDYGPKETFSQAWAKNTYTGRAVSSVIKKMVKPSTKGGGGGW